METAPKTQIESETIQIRPAPPSTIQRPRLREHHSKPLTRRQPAARCLQDLLPGWAFSVPPPPWLSSRHRHHQRPRTTNLHHSAAARLDPPLHHALRGAPTTIVANQGYF
ncbi:hypothetical protein ACQJBY_024303 [Aegilops geniculata]